MFDTWYTDRMRSHTVYSFQMFCMHQQSGKFIAVQFQSEQYAKSYIIDTALHRTVHRLGMVCIVVFRSLRMQFFVTLFVIRFLEQDIRSDSGFF